MAWRFALMGGLAGCLAIAEAQQSGNDQGPFRTRIAMVEVVAVVTGESDKSVLDLTAAEFQVFEDGDPRRLAMVRRLTTSRTAPSAPPSPPAVAAQLEQLATNKGTADAPAFVILLDDLNTSPYDTHRVIRAARGALQAVPGDALVAVLTTSGTDGTLLTLSRPGPEHIQRIERFRGQLLLAGPQGKSLGTRTTPSSVNAPCGVGSDVLHSQDCADPTRAARRASTVAAAARILGRAGARRKALLWVTPDMGISPLDPEGNRRAQKQALLHALNSDVAIYAVDPRENTGGRPEDTQDQRPEDTSERPDRRSGGTVRVGPGDSVFGGRGGGVIGLETDDMVAVPLTQLARETGGRYITAANDLGAVLARVIEQNTTSYLLAYESPVSHVPGHHRIEVRVLRPGARVYARGGYVVSPAAATAASEPQRSPPARLLRDTLTGSVSQGRLPLVVHVAPQFADGKDGRALVTVTLDGEVHEEAVHLMLATLDDVGNAGKQWPITMSPPPAGEPWEVTTELTLPRGRHQLRVAAVTADARRSGLVLTPVEILEPQRDLVMTPPVVLDATAGRVHPTAIRTFASGEPLGVQVEVGGRPVQRKAVSVRAALLDTAGHTVRQVEAVLDVGLKPDRVRATAVLPTDGIVAGDYVLIAEARTNSTDTPVRRAVPITLRSSGIIPHTVVAYGPSSRHPHGTLVIRTEEEWAAFWEHLPTGQLPPAIDFDRVTLLAVVLEPDTPGATEQPTVARIERQRDAAVVIWQTQTGRTSSAAPKLENQLRPFVVVGLAEPVGLVRFHRIGVP